MKKILTITAIAMLTGCSMSVVSPEDNDSREIKTDSQYEGIHQQYTKEKGEACKAHFENGWIGDDIVGTIVYIPFLTHENYKVSITCNVNDGLYIELPESI